MRKGEGERGGEKGRGKGEGEGRWGEVRWDDVR